jgi:hypothetical protein
MRLKDKYGLRFVHQVHDELVFIVEDKVRRVVRRVSRLPHRRWTFSGDDDVVQQRTLADQAKSGWSM